MAGEITFNASLNFSKPGVTANGSVSKATPVLSINVAGEQYVQGSGIAPIAGSTGAVPIPLGGVTNPGVMWIANLDPLNYLTIGHQAGGGEGSIKIKAGETWPVRFNDAQVPYILGNTAPVPYEYLIISA